jgi:hypothetical protein
MSCSITISRQFIEIVFFAEKNCGNSERILDLYFFFYFFGESI